MHARDLINAARARGLLTKAEADVLWCQELTAAEVARVLLILLIGVTALCVADTEVRQSPCARPWQNMFGDETGA